MLGDPLFIHKGVIASTLHTSFFELEKCTAFEIKALEALSRYVIKYIKPNPFKVPDNNG